VGGRLSLLLFANALLKSDVMSYLKDLVKAGWVIQVEDWPFSSARAYAGLTEDSLCNHALAKELLK
jgi:hypothetical protein